MATFTVAIPTGSKDKHALCLSRAAGKLPAEAG